jgi:Flp pilus assembly protein TadG
VATDTSKKSPDTADCSSALQGEPFQPRRSNCFLKRLTKCISNNDGVTAVEFAMVAPVLILLVTGIIEFGLIFAADIVLKNATYDASRTGRTGFITEESTQDGTVQKIVRQEAGILMDADKISIKSSAYSGFDTLQKPEPFIDKNKNGVRDDGENFTDVNGNGVYDLDQGRTGYGGTSEVVLYTVTYPWRLFTPLIGKIIGTDGVLTLRATAIVQNEPY